MTPSNRRSSPMPAPAEDASERAFRANELRRPQRWLSTLRTWGGGVLVAATSIGVAWVARHHVMTSPRFGIASIEVIGNEHRPAQTIIAESGLALGENVFVADLDLAQARVASDPWIANVSLARRLPGIILMQVTERRAAALVAMGDTFLTTPDGEPFKKLEPDDLNDEIAQLPLVTGLRPESLSDDRLGTTRTIRRAIDLAAEFERSSLAKRSPLEEVHVEADGAYSLVVGKGATQIILGPPPFRRKLDQAARVAAELDKRGAKADAIMVDNDTRPDRVVVRMR